MSNTVDYIVVGAGSAGCVLANRLSENGKYTVCLLEAGPRDRNPWIHIPIGYGKTMFHDTLNWGFHTDPDANMLGRRIYWPRGRTLGGSSSINGLIYIRGQRQDYDRWKDSGNPGWGWEECLPYFRKLETNDLGAGPTRGTRGPLNATSIKTGHPLVEALIRAGEELGLERRRDFNEGDNEGIGYYQLTTRGGKRCSTAVAYLDPARRRANLRIETGAQVTGLLMEGTRARGVAYRKNGRNLALRAAREVILSAGAFGSPQLLLLSGIGPAADLQKVGVPVMHDLPGVGKNLQDHIDYVQTWRVPSHTDTFGVSLRGSARLTGAMLEWKKQRTGMVTSSIATCGAFFRSAPDVAVPDLQLVFVLGIVDDHARKLHLGHGISCHVDLLRPHSRGTVSLASPDPHDAPLIDPKFLTDERDLPVLVKGGQMQQRILESKPFDPIRGPMLYPVRADDAAAMAQDIRNRADTQYHPVGTCKMGPYSDPMAVVDAQLRVRGIDGLRVADASVMPTLIGGNTNAPSIMIGEKLADLLRSNA